MLGVSVNLNIITPEKASKLRKIKAAIPMLCNAPDQVDVQYILSMLRKKLLNIHSYIQNMFATLVPLITVHSY